MKQPPIIEESPVTKTNLKMVPTKCENFWVNKDDSHEACIAPLTSIIVFASGWCACCTEHRDDLLQSIEFAEPFMVMSVDVFLEYQKTAYEHLPD